MPLTLMLLPGSECQHGRWHLRFEVATHIHVASLSLMPCALIAVLIIYHVSLS